MPRLTQIKETKKGRLALFLDGEFAFSLDEDTFAAAALHQDDELEDWQIEELRKKSETRRALDKAMDYLSLRDHAAGELYQKLCRKFDAHSAAYAVARTGELGLLNDVSFARRRAAELLAGNGYAVDTGFHVSYSMVIMGILILFAAEVFAIGQNLSEEQKLTI